MYSIYKYELRTAYEKRAQLYVLTLIIIKMSSIKFYIHLN